MYKESSFYFAFISRARCRGSRASFDVESGVSSWTWLDVTDGDLDVIVTFIAVFFVLYSLLFAISFVSFLSGRPRVIWNREIMFRKCYGIEGDGV